MSRAALYDEVGGPEVLYIGQVPDRDPAAGKVAVRVRAAGVNPYDAKVRSGFISLDAEFPRRIGADLAGTVEAVGEGAVYTDGSAISVGDEVAGRGHGALAERVIVSASGLTRRPSGVPAEVAGGLNVPGLTAVSCLATVPIGDDDTVLVGGASGAVGLVVSQLARAEGARVIGTASPRHHEFVRSLGVEPVAYGEGLADRVAALGIPTAIVDCHGRDALDAGVALGVATDRMVAIAAYAALKEIPAHNVERSARTPENLAKLLDRIAEGTLVFPVAETFELDDIAEAFAAVESSHDPGKIVVVP